ncbi:hypothetical protein VTO73DRAFT_2312 [Trametes versicolor]
MWRPYTAKGVGRFSVCRGRYHSGPPWIEAYARGKASCPSTLLRFGSHRHPISSKIKVANVVNALSVTGKWALEVIRDTHPTSVRPHYLQTRRTPFPTSRRHPRHARSAARCRELCW